MIAWRVSKQRHPAYDGTGAFLHGARWSSSGRRIIYAADSFAGAILEILAHSLRPRSLPGPHHTIRIEIPDSLTEHLDPADLPGWKPRDSPVARAYGDRWYAERRTPALVVPALPAQPIGRNLLINPEHPESEQIVVGAAFPVPWDERLF